MDKQNVPYIPIIEQAVKAPSGHNTQPWIFDIEKNEVIIRPDFSKSLPVVDPCHRELYISLGCAAENFSIAASAFGYRTEIKVEKTDKEYRIRLQTTPDKSIPPSPLYPFIGKRQVNRRVYDSRIIPEKSMMQIMHISREDEVRFYAFQNGTSDFEILRKYILEGNNRQMNDTAFKDELKSWMRFNKKHSEATRDGLSYAVFGAPDLPAFISRPVMSSFLKSSIQNKGDNRKITSSSHLLLFTTNDNTVESWMASGRTLQRFLLTAAREGIACAFLNQPCEVEKLAMEIQNNLLTDKAYPTLLLRLGYAKTVPYSLRKEVGDVIKEQDNTE